MRVRLVFAALVVVLASCSRDGRTLRPAGPDQTLTIKTVATTVASADTTVGTAIGRADLIFTAPWEDGGTIPRIYTCEGLDQSPDLQWSGIGTETVEIVVSVIDLDADDAVHWLIAGLDPATTGITKGKVPRGATQAINSFGIAAWKGPCPKDREHRYLTTLYALAAPSGVTSSMTAVEARAKLETIVANRTALTGGYSPGQG